MTAPVRALSALSLLMISHLVSARAEVRRDVEYSSPGGVRLAMDISIPEGGGLHPAAIVVHGGGWVRGDRETDVAPLFEPLNKAGIAWFSISYRLASDITQFGVAVDDVKAAIRFVKLHAAEYRIDPNRIALIGESAGGQLAAMAALSDDPELSVLCVVALYAPTDLVSLAKNSALVPSQIREQLKGSPFEAFILEGLKQLSPIDNVHRDMPPFLLIHGTADALVPFSQSTAMCDRIKAVGSACKLVPVEGGGHGIRWWESSASLRSSYKREMIQWLEEQFGHKTAV